MDAIPNPDVSLSLSVSKSDLIQVADSLPDVTVDSSMEPDQTVIKPMEPGAI